MPPKAKTKTRPKAKSPTAKKPQSVKERSTRKPPSIQVKPGHGGYVIASKVYKGNLGSAKVSDLKALLQIMPGIKKHLIVTE